jgi:hypothetical protein
VQVQSTTPLPTPPKSKEAIHLQRLLGDLGHSCIHPIEMYIDNQSAIKQPNAHVLVSA